MSVPCTFLLRVMSVPSTFLSIVMPVPRTFLLPKMSVPLHSSIHRLNFNLVMNGLNEHSDIWTSRAASSQLKSSALVPWTFGPLIFSGWGGGKKSYTYFQLEDELHGHGVDDTELEDDTGPRFIG